MSKENVSIRIFGRDMTFSVSPKEKNDLIKSAEILNNELDNILYYTYSPLAVTSSNTPIGELTKQNSFIYLYPISINR